MSLDPYILTILSHIPSTGYNIRAESSHKGSPLLWGGVSFGTIFPRLQKMEEEGLIRIDTKEEEGRSKKVYDLTPKGWETLYHWCALPPAYPIVRDELFLKMMAVHSTRPEDRGLLIDHLHDRRRETEEMLEYCVQWPKNNFSFISEYGMLVIELAASKLEAELAWIDKAIAKLEGPPTGPVQDPHGLEGKIAARRTAAFAKMKERGEHRDE